MRQHQKGSFYIMSIILVDILWLLTGCKSAETSDIHSIISAKEYYPQLLEKAQAWQADAYLDYLIIKLTPSSSVIGGFFLSPTNPNEKLGVDVFQDGTISTEVYFLSITLRGHEPIQESDWLIDSQAALNIILEKQPTIRIDFSRLTTSCLKLERFLAARNQPVVWHLVYDDDPTTMHYYLDPITGELLELSRDFFPTRFFTPTP